MPVASPTPWPSAWPPPGPAPAVAAALAGWRQAGPRVAPRAACQGGTAIGAVAALESNLWSMWRQFGLGDGCRLVDEPGLLRFETPIAAVPYNSVVRFVAPDGAGDAEIDATIDGIVESYRARSVPLMWLIHPTRRPADLARRLEARGLVEDEVVTGMVAPVDRLPEPGAAPEGITVAELRPGHEDPYLALLSWRFGLPPGAEDVVRSIMTAGRFGRPGSTNRAWMAVDDGGRVVSKAGLHLSDGGRVAGIYGVATRTDARGLGLARLLTLHALAGARRTGARLAVLHSTPMAVGLYRSLGFTAVADFPLHASPGSLHL